jgi:hypothetical protein
MLEDLLPLNDELAKLPTLAWKEIDQHDPEFARKAKNASPLAE